MRLCAFTSHFFVSGFSSTKNSLDDFNRSSQFSTRISSEPLIAGAVQRQLNNIFLHSMPQAEWLHREFIYESVPLSFVFRVGRFRTSVGDGRSHRTGVCQQRRRNTAWALDSWCSVRRRSSPVGLFDGGHGKHQFPGHHFESSSSKTSSTRASLKFMGFGFSKPSDHSGKQPPSTPTVP